MNKQNILNARQEFEKAKQNYENELQKGFEIGFSKLSKLIIELANKDNDYVYSTRYTHEFELDFPKLSEENHSDYYPTYYHIGCRLKQDYDCENDKYIFTELEWISKQYNGGDYSDSSTLYFSDYCLSESNICIEDIEREIKSIEEILKEIEN